MHVFLTLDQGPKFIGFTGRVDGGTVCVLTPAVYTSEQVRRVARELVRRRGRDCTICVADCPVRSSQQRE